MKKIYIAFACFSLILAGTGTAFAAANGFHNTAGTGGTLTVPQNSNNAQAFTFNASPSVYIMADMDSNAYAIETTNTVPDTSTGLVYGARNTDTGYAQRLKVSTEVGSAGVIADWSSTTSLDTKNTWTWMGGSS